MHIIIAGAARSGKTTLSLMLKNKYVHYKMDSIKRGICEAYNLKYNNWEELSPIMCTIINKIIKDNKSDTNYLKEQYLFDIPFLYPKDIEMIDTENTIVIFLGYAHLTPDESFKQIRENDSSNLWTSRASDEKLKEWCIDNVNFSKYLESECKRLNIKYFDTSNNRKEVLQEIINYIESTDQEI